MLGDDPGSRHSCTRWLGAAAVGCWTPGVDGLGLPRSRRRPHHLRHRRRPRCLGTSRARAAVAQDARAAVREIEAKLATDGGPALSWTSTPVPRLPGSRRGRRCACTTPRRGAVRPTAPGQHGRDVRLRDHPVRRHPPRARGHLPGVRPGAPGLAGRRARACTTCRTSPTSTTRCWSAPPRPATTGWSGRAGDPAVPRGHDGAAGAAAARTTSARSRRWTRSSR